MNANFLQEMTSIQEAYDTWRAGNRIEDLSDSNLPIKETATRELILNSKYGRLYGEIAYYRVWSETDAEPSIDEKSSTERFNNFFDGELYGMGSKIFDLYILDLDKIDYKSNNTYLLDATNEIIYRLNGMSINGVDVHSLSMYYLISSGRKDAPTYADSEVNGPAGGRPLANEYEGKEKYLMDSDGNYVDSHGNIVDAANKVENPNFDENSFKFITNSHTNNIYKLYADGSLYGKGLKGISLQTSQEKMDEIDSTVYQKFTIPEEIPSVEKIIHGNDTMYIIDKDGNLWAWGVNTFNKLGLTEEQQINFTGREPIQLNVGGEVTKEGKTIGSKPVYNVFDAVYRLYVVTESNELYVAGTNEKFSCGLGNNELVTKLTLCEFEDPKHIYQITSGRDFWYGDTIWYNDSDASVKVESKEWSNHNKFFYAGPNEGWGFGDIKNKSYPTFSKIWDGNDGQNIATQIKKGVTVTHGAIFLLQNGQIVQCGYSGNGVGSGFIGSRTEGSALKNRGDVKDKVFSNIWYKDYILVGLAEDGTLWGTSTDPKLIFGETEIDYLMHQLTVPFNTSELKEIQVVSNGVFYLLNDGTIYASGNYSGMGLGSDWSDTITGCVNLSSGTYAKSFPQINSFYGGECNLGYFEKETLSSGMWNYTYIGKDGNLYMLGNSSILFRNNILEKNWVLVAKNVKQFEVYGESCGYVDFDGNVFVAGNDSKLLGLNYDKNQKVKTFTEITQSEIKGKAKKIQFGSFICGVLTTSPNENDRKVYVTGEHWDGNGCYYGLGIDNVGQTDITDFQPVKYNNIVVTDVRDFALRYASRILQKYNGEVYCWGCWNSWKLNNPVGESTLVKSNANIGKIVDFFPYYRTSNIIDENGKLWYAGDHADYMVGGKTSTTDYVELTGEFNNEKMLQYEYSTGQYVLTETGKVYGWGRLNRLGIGSTNGEFVYDAKDTGITDVDYIIAGNDYVVAVKKDGTVWGTGGNTYGTLGRWKDKNGKKAISRYRTAFEWVRCPELEL